MQDSVKIVLLIIIIVSLVLSAFFSASEFIFSTVSQSRLKKEVEQGNKKAAVALNLATNYTNTLSIILIGNNLVNILISSMATALAVDQWGSASGPVYATVISTVLVLLFGEILPKTIAPKYNFTLAKLFSYFLKFFYYLFFPLNWVVNKGINAIVRLWSPKEKITPINEEELITITEELEEEGFIDQDDAELIKSAIEFIDIDAYEIMIHRVDVFAIDINDLDDNIFADPQIFTYSRVPVYEDDMDHIIGILNTTLLMKYLLKGEKVDIRSMLTQPLFVHKTRSISTILTEFKKLNLHMAVVVDEFGGVMGILTIEDILEELVGDIWDEMDQIEPDYIEVSENNYIIDADMNIYDFFDLVNYDDRDFESEYVTVGGWCTDVLEKFPQVGDHFDFSNFQVEILEAEALRVEKVQVIIQNTSAELDLDE